MLSKREDRIVKIIGNKKMTYKQISDKYYGEDKPFDAEILISNTVRRIAKKCSHYKTEWTLGNVRENSKLFIYKKEA